jgi:hypothetical protein
VLLNAAIGNGNQQVGQRLPQVLSDRGAFAEMITEVAKRMFEIEIFQLSWAV